MTDDELSSTGRQFVSYIYIYTYASTYKDIQEYARDTHGYLRIYKVIQTYTRIYKDIQGYTRSNAVFNSTGVCTPGVPTHQHSIINLYILLGQPGGGGIR